MDRLASVLRLIGVDARLISQVEENRRILNARRAAYAKARRLRDDGFALTTYCRSLLRSVLHGKGRSNSFRRMFGYSGHELRAHVQSLFKPGMTWDNYGKAWEIHHIIPVASYNMRDRNELRTCFAASNLQPLTKEEHKALKKA